MVASNISSLLQRVSGTLGAGDRQAHRRAADVREMLPTRAPAYNARSSIRHLESGGDASTKIIAESLGHWKKVPDAPSMRD